MNSTASLISHWRPAVSPRSRSTASLPNAAISDAACRASQDDDASISTPASTNTSSIRSLNLRSTSGSSAGSVGSAAGAAGAVSCAWSSAPGASCVSSAVAGPAVDCSSRSSCGSSTKSSGTSTILPSAACIGDCAPYAGLQGPPTSRRIPRVSKVNSTEVAIVVFCSLSVVSRVATFVAMVCVCCSSWAATERTRASRSSLSGVMIWTSTGSISLLAKLS
mmetsp:Transcript_85425/g.228428  ORF Transcript_85425/g.228428 Transcript_85425/m.228428 type:complete len:221 (+) Transcript_85425:495-1157(+)